MSVRLRCGLLSAVSLVAFMGAFTSPHAQVVLPEISVTAPSPIQSGASPGAGDGLQGTLPIVTDQFATVTVVPGDDIRRSGASTLGDLLVGKPRPVIRVSSSNRPPCERKR